MKNMKDNIKIITLTVFLIALFAFIAYYYQSKKNPAKNITVTNTEETVSGCYIGYLGKDVFTLSITSLQEESIEGGLYIKNFEKDSSTGTIKGTYTNGILLADYTFLSEGTVSTGQVIFKRLGEDFIRGYGKPDDATGTRFVDLDKITYDSSVVYKRSSSRCVIPSTLN